MFQAPQSGALILRVQASVSNVSPTKTGLTVYVNEAKVWPEDADFHSLSAETYTLDLPLEVAQGDRIYAVIDSIASNISFDETAIAIVACYPDAE
jgi:hypothetical protein